ncbi:hypothetical protein AB0E81_17575 [Streptomyces sp. NPDC033538]|uniref:hypothetical protein n=1 Tax=Streptomyces sp. NPDC033538 TaxID=3155367 RepID=UPI0033C4CEF9
MTEPIGRLVTWLSLLLKPRGTHRRRSLRPTARTAPHHPATVGMVPLPLHRSPYGLPSVLDGAGTVPVRPYVLVGAPYELEAAA